MLMIQRSPTEIASTHNFFRFLQALLRPRNIRRCLSTRERFPYRVSPPIIVIASCGGGCPLSNTVALPVPRAPPRHRHWWQSPPRTLVGDVLRGHRLLPLLSPGDRAPGTHDVCGDHPLHRFRRSGNRQSIPGGVWRRRRNRTRHDVWLPRSRGAPRVPWFHGSQHPVARDSCGDRKAFPLCCQLQAHRS